MKLISPGLVAALLFLVVQIVSFTLLFIVRYHYRLFALPGDRRARFIIRVFNFGLIALAFLGLVILFSILK